MPFCAHAGARRANDESTSGRGWLVGARRRVNHPNIPWLRPNEARWVNQGEGLIQARWLTQRSSFKVQTFDSNFIILELNTDGKFFSETHFPPFLVLSWFQKIHAISTYVLPWAISYRLFSKLCLPPKKTPANFVFYGKRKFGQLPEGFFNEVYKTIAFVNPKGNERYLPFKIICGSASKRQTVA